MHIGFPWWGHKEGTPCPRWFESMALPFTCWPQMDLCVARALVLTSTVSSIKDAANLKIRLGVLEGVASLRVREEGGVSSVP